MIVYNILILITNDYFITMSQLSKCRSPSLSNSLVEKTWFACVSKVYVALVVQCPHRATTTFD